MEKGTIARRRQKDTAQFGRPPTRLRHHNRTQSDVPSQPDSPRSPIAIRRNEDGFFEGINKGHKRNDTAPTTKSSVYEENPKNFTVVNVGAGGVLYLYVRARACWRAHAHTHTPLSLPGVRFRAVASDMPNDALGDRRCCFFLLSPCDMALILLETCANLLPWTLGNRVVCQFPIPTMLRRHLRPPQMAPNRTIRATRTKASSLCCEKAPHRYILGPERRASRDRTPLQMYSRICRLAAFRIGITDEGPDLRLVLPWAAE